MISYGVIGHNIELGESILEEYKWSGKKIFSFTGVWSELGAR